VRYQSPRASAPCSSACSEMACFIVYAVGMADGVLAKSGCRCKDTAGYLSSVAVTLQSSCSQDPQVVIYGCGHLAQAIAGLFAGAVVRLRITIMHMMCMLSRP
jgi:hypothetical protein